MRWIALARWLVLLLAGGVLQAGPAVLWCGVEAGEEVPPGLVARLNEAVPEQMGWRQDRVEVRRVDAEAARKLREAIQQGEEVEVVKGDWTKDPVLVLRLVPEEARYRVQFRLSTAEGASTLWLWQRVCERGGLEEAMGEAMGELSTQFPVEVGVAAFTEEGEIVLGGGLGAGVRAGDLFELSREGERLIRALVQVESVGEEEAWAYPKEGSVPTGSAEGWVAKRFVRSGRVNDVRPVLTWWGVDGEGLSKEEQATANLLEIYFDQGLQQQTKRFRVRGMTKGDQRRKATRIKALWAMDQEVEVTEDSWAGNLEASLRMSLKEGRRVAQLLVSKAGEGEDGVRVEVVTIEFSGKSSVQALNRHMARLAARLESKFSLNAKVQEVTELEGGREILVLLDRGRKDGVVMGDRFVLKLADGGELLFTMDRLFDEACQCRAKSGGEKGPSKMELVSLLERPLSLLKEPPIFLAIQAEEGAAQLTRLSGAIVHSIQNERIFGGGVRIRKVSAGAEEVFDVQGVDFLLSLKEESGGKVRVAVSGPDGGRIDPVTSVFPEDETTLEFTQKYIALLGELGKALSLSPVRSLRAARISDVAAVREAYFEAVSLAAQGQDGRAREVLEAAVLEDGESYECLALLGELRMRGVPLAERSEEELLELAGAWEESLSLAEEDHLRKGFGRVVFEQDLGAYVVPPPFIVPEQQLLVHVEAGALSSAGLRRLERSISRLNGLDCVLVERVLPVDAEGVKEWVLDNNGKALVQFRGGAEGAEIRGWHGVPLRASDWMAVDVAAEEGFEKGIGAALSGSEIALKWEEAEAISSSVYRLETVAVAGNFGLSLKSFRGLEAGAEKVLGAEILETPLAIGSDLLLVYARDASVRLVKREGLEAVSVWKAGAGISAVTHLAVHPRMDRVAFGASDGRVYQVEIKDGEVGLLSASEALSPLWKTGGSVDGGRTTETIPMSVFFPYVRLYPAPTFFRDEVAVAIPTGVLSVLDREGKLLEDEDTLESVDPVDIGGIVRHAPVFAEGQLVVLADHRVGVSPDPTRMKWFRFAEELGEENLASAEASLSTMEGVGPSAVMEVEKEHYLLIPYNQPDGNCSLLALRLGRRPELLKLRTLPGHMTQAPLVLKNEVICCSSTGASLGEGEVGIGHATVLPFDGTLKALREGKEIAHRFAAGLFYPPCPVNPGKFTVFPLGHPYIAESGFEVLDLYTSKRLLGQEEGAGERLSLFQAPRVVNGFLMLYGQNREGCVLRALDLSVSEDEQDAVGRAQRALARLAVELGNFYEAESYVEELIEGNSSDRDTWEIAMLLAKRRGSMEGQVRALGRLILLESDPLRVAEWTAELAAVTGLRWKREEARAIRQVSALKGKGVFVLDGDQTLIGLGEQKGEALGWVHLDRPEGAAEICGFEKVLWGGAEEQSILRLGLDWDAGEDAVGESCAVFGELGLKEEQRILGQLFIAGRLLLVPYAETGKAGGGVVAVSRKDGSVVWNVALSGQLWQAPLLTEDGAFGVTHNGKYVAIDLGSGAAVEKELRSMENSRIEWCSELFDGQFLVYVETTVNIPVESVVRAVDVQSGGVVSLVERHGGRYVHAPRVAEGQVVLFPADSYGDGWRVESWRQEGEEMELVWETTGRGGQLASAEVLGGLLGLTNGEGEVSLLDPAREGREVWAWKLSGKAVGAPVVEGGTLYLASVNGQLAAFDFDEILRRRNGE